jgi:hypothetical protein
MLRMAMLVGVDPLNDNWSMNSSILEHIVQTELPLLQIFGYKSSRKIFAKPR